MQNLSEFGVIIEKAEYGLLKSTAEYYSLLAQAIESSSEYTIVIGWDFGMETEYKEGCTFRELFEKKFEENPEYKLYVLIWSGIRIGLSWKKFKFVRKLKNKNNIVLKLATDFPIGGSHHAKVVSVDGKIVFTGGIDMVHGREDDQKYMKNQFQDIGWVLKGEKVIDYFNKYIVKRWDKFFDIGSIIKSDLKEIEIDYRFRSGKFLISENMFKSFSYSRKNEVKFWTFNLIDKAKYSIYMQNQYFASEVVRRKLKAKINNVNNFKIKIMLPDKSENWLARMTIDKISYINMRKLGADYFYNLYNKNNQPVYVHGKVMVVDDKYLKVGSSNMADRSFGVDSEIDVTLIAENTDDRRFIKSYQNEQWLVGSHDGLDFNKIKLARHMSRWYYFLPFWFCDLFDGRFKSYKL